MHQSLKTKPLPLPTSLAKRVGIRPLDLSSFRQMKASEMQLSSWFDHTDGLEMDGFVVTIDGTDAGMLDILSAINPQKSSGRDVYSRIDLVIVREPFRDLGLGRFMMILSLQQMLRSFSHRIYSVSSLAAHPTVEKYLSTLGFHCEIRKKEDQYSHCSLSVDDQNYEALLASFEKELERCGRQFNFRLRQRG